MTETNTNKFFPRIVWARLRISLWRRLTKLYKTFVYRKSGGQTKKNSFVRNRSDQPRAGNGTGPAFLESWHQAFSATGSYVAQRIFRSTDFLRSEQDQGGGRALSALYVTRGGPISFPASPFVGFAESSHINSELGRDQNCDLLMSIAFCQKAKDTHR